MKFWFLLSTAFVVQCGLIHSTPVPDSDPATGYADKLKRLQKEWEEWDKTMKNDEYFKWYLDMTE